MVVRWQVCQEVDQVLKGAAFLSREAAEVPSLRGSLVDGVQRPEVTRMVLAVLRRMAGVDRVESATQITVMACGGGAGFGADLLAYGGVTMRATSGSRCPCDLRHAVK